jgi:hypothetical protein
MAMLVTVFNVDHSCGLYLMSRENTCERKRLSGSKKPQKGVKVLRPVQLIFMYSNITVRQNIIKAWEAFRAGMIE